MDLRPGRAPRPWTEGGADAAGLATEAEVEVGGAAAGAAWGSETAGSMSETIRGGKSGDGDAVAEAVAELLLETGAGLFFWLVLAIMSTSASAVASPLVATEDTAGTVGDGSSTPAGVIIMWPSALTADSMRGYVGENWFEARRCWQSVPRESSPPLKRSQVSPERVSSPSKRLNSCAQKSAWSTPESWFLLWLAKPAKDLSSGGL